MRVYPEASFYEIVYNAKGIGKTGSFAPYRANCRNIFWTHGMKVVYISKLIANNPRMRLLKSHRMCLKMQQTVSK